jgi:hypothetical protein
MPRSSTHAVSEQMSSYDRGAGVGSPLARVAASQAEAMPEAVVIASCTVGPCVAPTSHRFALAPRPRCSAWTLLSSPILPLCHPNYSLPLFECGCWPSLITDMMCVVWNRSRTASAGSVKTYRVHMLALFVIIPAIEDVLKLSIQSVVKSPIS